jgi:ATP-dependent Lon protease
MRRDEYPMADEFWEDVLSLDDDESEEDEMTSGIDVDAPVGAIEKEVEVPEVLPVLPVRDIVVFPYMILPLFVGREMSIRAIEDALATNRMVLLVTQKDQNTENPAPRDLFKTGVVGIIMRMLKLPDGRIKVLVQGVSKARVVEYVQTEPFFKARVVKIEERSLEQLPIEVEAMVRTVKEQMEKAVQFGKNILPDIMVVIENIEDPGRLADLVASNLGLKAEQAQEILELEDPVVRLRKVSDILSRELELLQVQQKIQTDARAEIDRSQREYFLREQLKSIQKELGDIDERAEEVREYRKKIKAAKMPPEVFKEAEKQMKRLQKMHPDSAEAATIRTYLDWMVDIPWAKSTKDKLDIKVARAVLDEDHYDLEKVKDRILEYLSVLKLKHDMKGPILCFIGPPGVGKTSLGKSIARSLGRKFVRMSLGGVRDEAEIRGHRRTYVGALPGRIVQGIKQAGTNNPVFMLDEIDKIGSDFRGDPSSALLEVLDPEQNNSFQDHYLTVPFDLSKVMFITTGNMIDTIPSPLRDRMELINLPGYTAEEKLGIAKIYLVPKQLEAHGLTPATLKIADAALMSVIAQYTREAGVRNLEREIAHLCRKVAKRIAEGEKRGRDITITPALVETYLGVPKFLPEEEMPTDQVGVATGLAWTQTGGDVIFIEATTMIGRGELTLTGQLGDVMKESARAALSYVRSRSKSLGIAEDAFGKTDIHVHVPAGATPKDGPSAGITMATALASALTGRAIDKRVAMTGEVTLRGRVLPIGGLKEKTLAARRLGITKLVIPARNRKDLEDIPPHIRKGLDIVLVDTMDDVLRVALLPLGPSGPSGKTRATHAPAAAAPKKKAARGTAAKKKAAPTTRRGR